MFCIIETNVADDEVEEVHGPYASKDEAEAQAVVLRDAWIKDNKGWMDEGGYEWEDLRGWDVWPLSPKGP